MLTLQTPPDTEQFKAFPAPENVSENDLAFIERLLAIIDMRNGVLSCINGWFSCWRETRDFCLIHANSTREVQEALAPRFKKLIENLIQQGKVLASMAVTDVLAIQDDHFKLATGCALADFGACITFLDDRLSEFFIAAPVEVETAKVPEESDNGTGCLV